MQWCCYRQNWKRFIAFDVYASWDYFLFGWDVAFGKGVYDINIHIAFLRFGVFYRKYPQENKGVKNAKHNHSK